jgi:hypothetical protein
MTDKTEAPAKLTVWEGFVVTVAVMAFVAWLGGVALNKGFGVHAPFIATWLLIVLGLTIVKAVTGEVASTWYTRVVQAAGPIAIADTLGAHAAEQAIEAEGFLAVNDRIKDMSSKVDGAYL